MRFSTILRGLVASVHALPGITPDSFQLRTRHPPMLKVFDHAATDSKLEYVSNSGICETTPGVEQHSGYLSVGGS